MFSLKRYFRKQREQRAAFRIRKKIQKKIKLIKAQLHQEKNKSLQRLLTLSDSLKKIF